MDFLREKSAGETRTPATRYWQEYLAIKDNHDPRLADLSLTNKADKVGVPVMLIHGRDDTVVPFDQSERMAAALKKAGKPVELVVLKGEDHWLSRSQTRLQMLTRSVAFLEACNPPG